MAKKTRIKDDAFDWVKDTTKEVEEKTPEKAESPKPKQPAKRGTVKKSVKKSPSAAKTAMPRKKAAARSKKASVKFSEPSPKTPSISLSKPSATPPAPKPAPAPQEPVLVKAASKSIFVWYRKRDGHIISLREKTPGSRVTLQSIRAGIPRDHDIFEFTLTGGLASAPLIEIHTKYRVAFAGGTRRLAPKTRRTAG